MSFHRKVFLAMALAIFGVSLVFIFLTHMTVKGTIDAGIEETRGREIKFLKKELINFYKNSHSWEHAERLPLLNNIHQEHPEILVFDPQGRKVYHEGTSPKKIVRRLGIHHQLKLNNKVIGDFYYYDPEVANFSKIMIGTPISVVFMLLVSGSVLVVIALILAYRIAKWLAAPLQKLLPVLERLGKGELGIQVQVDTKDEYGKIAKAFNHMSKELERAETVRRNLTADVAHELRTPLTIISGKLDHLQQQGEMIKPESLLPLQDEMIRLNRLIEDLRILSLAEAGKLTLNKTQTDIYELATQLKLALEPLVEEKSIQLEIDKQTDETDILIDVNRMKQVFLNLLMNALRYTPELGRVYFRIKKMKDDDRLTIVVEDTGIGIAPEHLPHLFDRFYRTDDARARETGGTGLGLAIAKQYVLSHGGTISVESKVNVGTKFIIKI
ncbi:HAMP domain-containing protein [Bacillus sp. DNRA2]|uniref:sensor histidine kinase n=1 Tax=Bacillus sp. DNRA2 TaxID=2723053 RepID=UPI00145D7320|nr:ATP-binding protein [Bacillus sp. DNRA2]NMD71739.1 HAMP domain-containing protein [Bacillus sp. DNRA2]